MKVKKLAAAAAACALFATLGSNALADETSDFLANFNPVVTHEIISDDETSYHALAAEAKVEVPDGVVVDTGDFMWVINVREDELNPLSDTIADDSDKDETDKIDDDNASGSTSGTESSDITFDSDETAQSVSDENVSADADVVAESTVEGALHTAKLRAKGGTQITGGNFVLGLVLVLDTPLNEDSFDIDLQPADGAAVESSIQ